MDYEFCGGAEMKKHKAEMENTHEEKKLRLVLNLAVVPKNTNTVLKRTKSVPNTTKFKCRKKGLKRVDTKQKRQQLKGGKRFCM